MDGDARGGAALSVREVTGAPVKFVGMGEDMDRLEAFRADGMASRILGMGDVVGLMKDFEGVVDEEKAEKDAKRMLKGNFTFDDFLSQVEMLQNMGPLKDIMEKLPFFGESMPEGMNIDDRELHRTKAIVRSMTSAERNDPDLFKSQPARIKRVAKGSGREDKDVAELVQRFMFMRQMMGDIGQQAGMLGKIPGMKQLAAARKMKDVVRTGGLEHNPMMANLASELLEAAVAGDAPPDFLQQLMAGQRPQAPKGPKKPVDKQKKKADRKKQKAARRKSRK
jgi:signal recognition particle subunit SRP54